MNFAMKKQLILLFSLFYINTCESNSRNIQKRNASLTLPPNMNDCGDTMSCVRYMKAATECNNANCSYLLAYYPPSVATVDFFLSAIDAQFVAVGFTSDRSKRNSEIIACINENNTILLKIYSWIGIGHELVTIPYKETQAKILYNSTSNGIECLVERALIPWDPRVKDLQSLDLFQLYLWGNLQNGIPDILFDKEPDTDWPFSDEKYKLTTILNNRQTFSTAPKLEMYDYCGKYLSCIRFNYEVDNPTCTYEQCSYHLLYQPLQESKMVIFLSSVQNVDYVAVGFTHDKISLLDTEIIGCKKMPDGKIESFHYWLTNIHQISNPQVQTKGIKLGDGQPLANGLWCHVNKRVPVGKKDDNVDLYQLYLWGKTTSDGKPIFTTQPSKMLSSAKKLNLAGSPVNFYETLKASDSSTNEPLIFILILFGFTLNINQFHFI